MTARNISIETYYAHIESGEALKQWMKVLNALRAHEKPFTRSELSDLTGIRINAVCGRVNELIKAGLVSEGDRRKCESTGKQAHELTAP